MNDYKICCTCEQNLHKSFFPKNKNGKLGVHSKCKNCFKKYRENNKKESCDINIKVCKKCNIEKSVADFQKRNNFKDGYDSSCIECRRNIEIYTTRKCCTCSISYECEPYKSSKERIRKCDNCKRKRNNRYRKIYVKNNKAKWAIRNIISQSFIRALKGEYNKSQKTEKLLGCTVQEAINYIETTFEEGMSWNNYGKCKGGDCTNVWHIDHKVPLASAKTKKELIKLCHHTNLQALWADINLQKGSKY